jgi:hypothetical protein
MLEQLPALYGFKKRVLEYTFSDILKITRGETHAYAQKEIIFQAM